MKENIKPKVSVFIATSLDGFISRLDGSIDWLTKSNGPVPAGEDCGYKDFISSIDTLVMGRNTFEQVLTFGDWPYKGKEVIVLSSKTINVPDEIKKYVTTSSDSPKKILHKLSEKNCNGIYIDGGITIQRFLAEGLIDEITITIIPVILGSGKPLFGVLNKDINLELIESKSYPFGLVQIKYKISRIL